jgi:hypothetical protein
MLLRLLRLRTCSWKLSFVSKVMPSHLICVEGVIVVVSLSELLGIVIDGRLLESFLRFVK